MVAGKEAGCVFYCILHTGFVPGRAGVYEVPLHMMDKVGRAEYGQGGAAASTEEGGAAACQGRERAWMRWGKSER